MYPSARSFEDPIVSVLLDPDGALLVETDATRVQDGGGENGVRDSWESVLVILGGLRETSVDAARRVQELLDGDVAVATLTVKVAALGG